MVDSYQPPIPCEHVWREIQGWWGHHSCEKCQAIGCEEGIGQHDLFEKNPEHNHDNIVPYKCDVRACKRDAVKLRDSKWSTFANRKYCAICHNIIKLKREKRERVQAQQLRKRRKRIQWRE